jgi:hypothetical protein
MVEEEIEELEPVIAGVELDDLPMNYAYDEMIYNGTTLKAIMTEILNQLQDDSLMPHLRIVEGAKTVWEYSDSDPEFHIWKPAKSRRDPLKIPRLKK